MLGIYMALTQEKKDKELARLRNIARKGGLALKKSRPKDYFKKIGSKGGRAKWGEKVAKK